MANTILTPTQVTRKALAILHNKLKFIRTINRQYDSQYARAGAKIGTTLKIREPNQFTVRSGAVMDAQDISETSQTLTLATQKGVDVNFSSVELTMSLDDFAERILEPAMARLAAEVESQVLSNVYKDIWNFSGTPATTPASLTAVMNGGTKLSQGLAPFNDRFLLFDSVAMAATVASVAAYFHRASEVERAFSEGMIGKASGFTWMESEMTPAHVNGDRDDTTPLTNAATAQTGASLICDGFDTSSTVKKGDVFTIADVFAVNEETKQSYSHLQQFVVTADGTASSGALTLAISPSITTTGAKQNVSTGAADNKALVFEAAGGSGTASATYTQDLCYHRDAFTFVSADLEMPRGVDFAAREVYDGISLRVVRQYDITNDKFPLRIDVLYGFKTIRPQWACRVRG